MIRYHLTICKSEQRKQQAELLTYLSNAYAHPRAQVLTRWANNARRKNKYSGVYN